MHTLYKTNNVDKESWEDKSLDAGMLSAHLERLDKNFKCFPSLRGVKFCPEKSTQTYSHFPSLDQQLASRSPYASDQGKENNYCRKFNQMTLVPTKGV
jgi:hypothetical protein